MEQDLETARKLFAGPCDFVLGVAELEQLPESGRPEVAFAGRSNAGKSSLINALTGRNTLAKTSATPGRTQQLNYFDLGGVLYMVDMPGYGYAKVSKSQRYDWNKLIKKYLCGRPDLQCVFILVDARHGLKESDDELMKMLGEAAVPFRIVLTKSDKAKGPELEKMKAEIEEKIGKLPAAIPEISATSAHEGTGIEELRAVIAGYAD
ncbi:MAG TPA: YihA family ribosome biogenesis GTP-binding protein [Rhodospirillaceae bacterium]|nr:YihA family ribosome biogenesis GTP-binding protein [Rhodospirillaceae bacterium]